MSLTNNELEERIIVIENTINDIQTALNNLAAKKTMNAAMSIRQQEIDALTVRIVALESQIQILQSG